MLFHVVEELSTLFWVRESSLLNNLLVSGSWLGDRLWLNLLGWSSNLEHNWLLLLWLQKDWVTLHLSP